MATTLSSTEREILAGLLGCEPCGNEYQRLEGSSHKLLSFAAHSDFVVARWPKVARPKHAWWREQSVQQLAAQHDLAPKVMALDAAMQSTLLPRIEPLRIELAGISQLLRQCHQLPKVSQKLDIAHAFIYWFELCQPQHRPWSKPVNRQKAERAAQKFTRYDRCLVQSHGDCVPTNILQIQNHAVFIDWEYHCLAPRWWDLAIYAEAQKLGLKATHTLLQGYHQAHPSPSDLTEFEAFRVIYAELAILWHCATMHTPNHYRTL